MPLTVLPFAALLCALALGPLGLSSSLAHNEDEHYRQQGAHVHGVGQLNVAVDGSALLVELISPAMDLVGFEHAPRNEAQRTA
ncbi:MAG: DUF2796 domain-containing protein, partial [Chromatiaceae bacterium]|nr:DUF2796 domain-containing protein [Chromatiaceae bacterium]